MAGWYITTTLLS